MKLITNFYWLCVLFYIFITPISLTGKAVDNQDYLEVYCNLSRKLKSLENKELVITFSDEMIPLGGTRSGKDLLEIFPGIEGEFYWRGTRILVFKPATRFKYATQYTVKINQDIHSLYNRTLTSSWEWAFTTPLAIPVEYRLQSKEYFGSFKEINKIIEEVGINEALYLKFTQPVSAPHLENYLSLRHRDSKHNIPVKITPDGDKIIQVKPKEKLKRGENYILEIKKGFKGIEGNIGTDTPFQVNLNTVPSFEFYQGKWWDEWNYKITLDDKRLLLQFSNPLGDIKPGYVKIFKIKSQTLIPLRNFNTHPGGYNNKYLRITIEEELNGGEELLIKIDKNLSNIYDEKLKKDIQVKVLVCTSRKPGFTSSWQGDRLTFKLKDIEQLDFDLFKLKYDGFIDLLNQLAAPSYGLLNRPGFRRQYIHLVSSKSIHNPTDSPADFSFNLLEETGSSRGFFGILPKKAVIFDGCQKDDIPYLFRETPPDLEIFHNRDMDFIASTDGHSHYLLVYNNKTLVPIKGSDIGILRDKHWVPLGKINGTGWGFFEKTLKAGDTIVAKNQNNNDFAFFKINKYDLREWQDPAEEFNICVFTERDFYQPGEIVHIGGVIKKMINDRITPAAFDKIEISIKDPDGELTWKQEVQPDIYGGFYTAFKTQKSLSNGYYDIWASYGKENEYKEIYIGYYQPNRFDIEVSGLQERYRLDEPFKAIIKGNYLSGNPMANDSFKYRLKLGSEVGPRFLYKDKKKSPYLFHFDTISYKEEISITGEGQLNANGEKILEFDLNQFKGLPAVRFLMFNVTGESKEGKEYDIYKDTVFFPGNRLIGIQPIPAPLVNRDLVFKVLCVDCTGNPVSCNADVTISRVINDYLDDFKEEKKIKTYKNIKFTGEDQFIYQFTTKGSYKIRFTAKDDDGNIVSTHILFKVHNEEVEEENIFFDIGPVKENYKIGEKAEISFNTNGKGRALITIGREKIIDSFLMEVGKDTRFTLDIKEEYFPAVNIKAAALLGHEIVKEAQTSIKVEEKRNKLKIDIRTPRGELLPSTRSRIKLKVSGYGNKGKKAKLFVYGVDEGVLSLSGYAPPGLYNYFYFPPWGWDWVDYFYIRTLNSFEQKKRLIQYPDFDIELKAPCVFGRVVKKDGTPIEGVQVTLDCSGTKKITTTSGSGSYAFNNLEEVGGTLFFQKQGFKSIMGYTRYSPYHSYSFYNAVMEPEMPPLKPPGIPGFILLNIVYRKSLIRGKCVLPDGVPLAGAVVILSGLERGKNEKPLPAWTIISSETGEFLFRRVNPGRYKLEFQTPGLKLKSKKISFNYKTYSVLAVFQLQEVQEDVSIRGILGAINTRTTQVATIGQRSGQDQSVEIDFSKIKLRGEGKPVLFFKHIETDENGNAQIDFKTSDRVSTYRIMVEAYNEDSFGSAAKQILVSKKLLLQEAMPEFSRTGDRFRAGVMVSSRKKKKIKTTVIAKSRGIKIEGKNRNNITLDKTANQLVYFNFQADQKGKAEIEFYARSKKDSDGLLKKLKVTGQQVWESRMDISSGKKITRTVHPIRGALEQKLKIMVSPFIISPGIKIAEKLFFFPYECMEQRTSKVLPYLVLDDSFLTALHTKPDKEQIRGSINKYITVVPEFMTQYNGVSYYRGGPGSRYLTAYVLWALYLAQKNGYEVSETLVEKMEKYLEKEQKSPGTTTCFIQYILSLKKKARKKILEKLYKTRDTLPVTGRMFLYKALHHQPDEKEKQAIMLKEFNNYLKVEPGYAYFDAGDYFYDAELPFYSSRFITAFLLQGILEVEGKYLYAPLMIKWLMESGAHGWDTTHTNIWILMAIDQYLEKVETGAAKQVVLTVLDEHRSRQFAPKAGRLLIEKDISRIKEPFDIQVTSDGNVYLTTELNYSLEEAPARDRGIHVQRFLYDDQGKIANKLRKGKIYQVEILIDAYKEVPYGVIDEPIPAGVEILREDIVTTRNNKEFNTQNASSFYSPWIRKEVLSDRMIGYTYWLKGKNRIVYFVKALYTGTFTWLPTVVQGMYHPWYYGRTAIQKITIKTKPFD